jgi:tryptophanase
LVCGLVACRTKEMYYKVVPWGILFEGFATYGLEITYEPPVKGLKHFLAHLKPKNL